MIGHFIFLRIVMPFTFAFQLLPSQYLVNEEIKRRWRLGASESADRFVLMISLNDFQRKKRGQWEESLEGKKSLVSEVLVSHATTRQKCKGKASVDITIQYLKAQSTSVWLGKTLTTSWQFNKTGAHGNVYQTSLNIISTYPTHFVSFLSYDTLLFAAL